MGIAARPARRAADRGDVRHRRQRHRVGQRARQGDRQGAADPYPGQRRSVGCGHRAHGEVTPRRMPTPTSAAAKWSKIATRPRRWSTRSSATSPSTATNMPPADKGEAEAACRGAPSPPWRATIPQRAEGRLRASEPGGHEDRRAHVYKAAGGAASAAGAGPQAEPGEAAGGENVVDAEFEELDETKKKSA